MKSLIIMLVFLAVASVAVYGDGASVLVQIDAVRGSGPVRTIALLSEQGELWY
ncbi:MAG: hypothetical protein UT11_C0069G0009, partial [Berkelbacteria bacterium GW2011_GWA2_38_9]